MHDDKILAEFDKRMRSLVAQTKAPVRRAMVTTALGVLAGESPCDIEPLPDIPGIHTEEGDHCRAKVRIAYLLAILLCEYNGFGTNCCAEAAEKFLKDYMACPL